MAKRKSPEERFDAALCAAQEAFQDLLDERDEALAEAENCEAEDEDED